MPYDYTLPDGTAIKVVPESDLMAVKTGAEKEKGELTTQMTELKSLVDSSAKGREETHTQLLQVQAAKEQLEAQIKEGTATKAQVEELQAKLTTAEESVGGLTTRLLDQKKVNISVSYGVDVNTLTGKTQEQLDSLEEALKLVGKRATPATLDLSGGGQGAAPPTTALEAAKAEIAGIRSK